MDDRTFVTGVMDRTGCDERRAETLIFVVFQELRDRLTPEEADDVAAQLPSSLRALWASFERPGRKVRRIHHREFLCEVTVAAALPSDADAARAVIALFGALQEALGSEPGAEGEARHLFSQLPHGLKSLWLDAAGRRAAPPAAERGGLCHP
jgi:uncharacterized protein (DUF2267 family)